MSFSISYYSAEIEQYRHYLSIADPRLLKAWNSRLSHGPEAAISECLLHAYFVDREISIDIYESPINGGPDFLCSTNDGYQFVVECKTLKIETVVRQTGATDNFPEEGRLVFKRPGLTKLIKQAASKTHSQLSGQGFPRLLVVSTFHFQAATQLNLNFAETLLVGYTYRAIPYGRTVGVALPESYEATSLQNSIFLRKQKCSGKQIENARSWLDAIVVLGFGSNPVQSIGVLNHASQPPFNRNIFPGTPFLKLRGDITAESINVEQI